ncbi:hypothetical protein [Ruminococcus sp. FC2018]|uniref:hypothetical protein n=1 Tax=Ruminococcus sp. FC2018 TaxID=1410617 RepID=UPI00048BB9DD|nr:hypothetical protein [Ruminococcus sp. FC2018]
MEGIYNDVKCRTGEQRINGEWVKALIYDTELDGENEQALVKAGFTDLENGLWAKVLTNEQYREINKAFEQQREKREKQQLRQKKQQNEKDINFETRRQAYNSKMASRRAKMRTLKLDFAGISIFAEIISFALIVISVLYRSDRELRYLALPMWVSLSFMPLSIVGVALAAYKKAPEFYIVLAGIMVIAAVAVHDMASLTLGIIAAAYVAFYLLTHSITNMKSEPEYPDYFDKSPGEFR